MVEEERNNEVRATLPSLPGTYALVLSASACQKFAVGRLGTLTVEPGFYLYVGSAFGPGGLAARVGRHCRREKTCRWHVDYLRAVTHTRRGVVRGRKEPPGVPVGGSVGQDAEGVRAPGGIRCLGLPMPVAPAFLYHSAVLQLIPPESAGAGRSGGCGWQRPGEPLRALLLFCWTPRLVELGGKLLADPLAEGLLDGLAGIPA